MFNVYVHDHHCGAVTQHQARDEILILRRPVPELRPCSAMSLCAQYVTRCRTCQITTERYFTRRCFPSARSAPHHVASQAHSTVGRARAQFGQLLPFAALTEPQRVVAFHEILNDVLDTVLDVSRT